MVIEGSPDHWWVTASSSVNLYSLDLLKGHQIIGELRPWKSTSMRLMLLLKGHQIIGELRHTYINFHKISSIEGSPDHWWVTASIGTCLKSTSKLKGHQIIGELRLIKDWLIEWVLQLKGHQIIGELRQPCRQFTSSRKIEGSPDHWWVTT